MHPITAHEFSGQPATDSVTGSDAERKRRCSRWTGAALLLACLTLQDAWGLALGQARVQSALGEPLRASIDLPALSAEEAETLQVVIPDAAAFQAAGLEYRPALNNLVLQVERRPAGQAWLSLQGRQAVNDVYLDVLLQANWQGGQLTRRYSLLLNPASGTAYPAEVQAMPATLPALQQAEGIPLPPAQPGPAASRGAPGESRPGQPQPRILSAQAPAAASSAAAPPASATTTPAAATVAPAAPDQVDTGQAAAAGAQNTTPADMATAATTPSASRPIKPRPAPEDQSQGSWPERLTQPAWLGAAALLLACLAGLLVWQRKRQAASQWSTAADDSSTPPSEADLAQSPQGAAALPGAPPVASAPAADAATAVEIDPVVEANVYLAYGRVQQAEEILRDAVRTHPDALGPRLKLLEMAVQRNDRPGSAQLLAAIADLTGSSGTEWSRACEMLAQLPPERPTSQSAQPADSSDAPAASSASATPLEFDPDVPTPAAEPAPAAPGQSAAVGQTQDQGLDFELDPNEIRHTRTARDAWDVNAGAPALTARKPDTMLALEPREQIAHDELSGLQVREDNTDPDPLATQMELAEEFVALGDVQAARPLAERVQALATGELQSRARALLQQLDAGPH